MKKRLIVGVIAGLLVVGGISGDNKPQTSNIEPEKSTSSVADTHAQELSKKVTPICDGVSITSDCKEKGISYKKYVYHPAVPQKSHTKTITTYREEVVSSCTLCNDGTYSPTCATGRGACSWHGGVAQWNAPVTSKVPVTTTKTIIDSPARKAFYEKIKD